MKWRIQTAAAACSVFAMLMTGVPARGAAPSDETVQKVVKTLITAIRYNKDDLAAKQLNFSTMVQEIMGDNWPKLSDAQRKELIAGMEKLVRGRSFKKGREMFQHLDAIRYDKVRMQDDRAIVKSTVVVHHKLKKQEIVIEFVLAQHAGKWQIIDTILLGQSTAEGIREDQIEPLVDEGGIAAVIKAMRDKVAELKS